MKIRDKEKVASMRSISLAWTEYHTKQAKSQHRQRCRTSLVMPREDSRFKPILGRHLPAPLLDAHVGVKTVVTSRPRGHAGGDGRVRQAQDAIGLTPRECKSLVAFVGLVVFSRANRLSGAPSYCCASPHTSSSSSLQAFKTRHFD